MSNVIYHLDYSFDKIKLMNEINSYELMKFSSLNNDWLKSQNTANTGSYGSQIFNHFKQFAEGRVATFYYKQPAGTNINEHKDTKCKCRINVKLTDDNAILTIADQKIQYDAALLNVSEYAHSVNETDKDRIIFSIIYLDDDFDDVKDKISSS